MIDPQVRLFCPDGSIGFEPQELSTWNFIDYDTRRWLVFEGPTDPFGNDDGERAIEVLLPVLDKLNKNVTKVSFSADGQTWKTTCRPDDNISPVIDYPKFSPNEVGQFAQETINRDGLVEIDRFAPGLDLVQVSVDGNTAELFVFRYTIVPRPRPLRTLWTSAFILRALGSHPNIIQFAHFVVDEVTSQYLGYTTRYISGIPLNNSNLSTLSTFKRSWLQQLMDAVDMLNLRYGVVHQDIAPRNLILQTRSDRMVLCDFEYAALIGSPDIMPICDDVRDLCYTVYEILTGDQQLSPYIESRESSFVLSPEKPWQLRDNLTLEQGMTTDMFKSELALWVKKRQNSRLSTEFEMQKSVVIPEAQIEHIQKAHPRPDGTFGQAYLIRTADPNAHIVRWERPSYEEAGLPRRTKGVIEADF